MIGSLGLAGIILAATITPGPNNMLVADVAATRSLGALAGVMAAILAGSTAMLAMAHFGFGALLETSPALHFGLKLAGAAILVWLGLAMMRPKAGAGAPGHGGAIGPDAVLALQFVNPKGWALMLAIIAFEGSWARAALVLGALSFVCLSLWAAAGLGLRKHLAVAGRRRIFDAAMGLVLILSAPLMLV
jgi:threonine/homoserine/homoserine lactone efflux protein